MDAFNFDSKDEVIAAAIRFVEERATYTSDTLQSPRASKDILRLRIGDKEREIFCVLYLNSQHKLIEVDELLWEPSMALPSTRGRSPRRP